jgi:hypothetical protein
MLVLAVVACCAVMAGQSAAASSINIDEITLEAMRAARGPMADGAFLGKVLLGMQRVTNGAMAATMCPDSYSLEEHKKRLEIIIKDTEGSIPPDVHGIGTDNHKRLIAFAINGQSEYTIANTKDRLEKGELILSDKERCGRLVSSLK